MYTSIPYLQFRTQSIINYSLPESRPIRSEELKAMQRVKLRESITYTGQLRPGAKKRLTRVVELFVQALLSKPKRWIIYDTKRNKGMYFRTSFLTLTIHSPNRMIEGKEAHKRCLEPFLQWMRRQHGCKIYIWKAELQQRGQLHYHITSDVFIDKWAVQRYWNELNRQAGYLDEFYAVHGHYKAPSTKIHKVAKDDRLCGYFIKEIVKTFQNDKSVGGKVWDCSMNLKAENYFTTLADNSYIEKLNWLVQTGKAKVIVTDNCTLYKMTDTPSNYLLSRPDLERYDQQMNNILRADFEKPVSKEISVKQFLQIIDKPPPKKVQFLPIPDLFSSS